MKQVKDVMTKEVITVKRSTTLTQLLQRFAKFHMFPLVPVADDSSRLIGIVSFRNLIDVFLPHKTDMLKAVPFLDDAREDIFDSDLTSEMGSLIVVEDIMEKQFISIQQETSLQEAYNIMKLHLQDQFPVVDRSANLVGMVGIFDIIRELFREKEII